MTLLSLNIIPGAGWLVGVLFAGGVSQVWLARRTESPPVPPAAVTTTAIRLWRAMVIANAILLAYPNLFGLNAAPPITDLLGGLANARVLACGAAFVCSVLLVTVMRSDAYRVAIEAVQSIALTAALFELFVSDLGATSARAWPGLAAALPVIVVMLLTPQLAAAISRQLESRPLLQSALSLVAQAPVVLTYGYVLGQQIAIG